MPQGYTASMFTPGALPLSRTACRLPCIPCCGLLRGQGRKWKGARGVTLMARSWRAGTAAAPHTVPTLAAHDTSSSGPPQLSQRCWSNFGCHPKPPHLKQDRRHPPPAQPRCVRCSSTPGPLPSAPAAAGWPPPCIHRPTGTTAPRRRHRPSESRPQLATSHGMGRSGPGPQPLTRPPAGRQIGWTTSGPGPGWSWTARLT